MDALVALIGDLKAARAAGRGDAELAAARDFQRKAQFFLARQGQLALRR